jgi:hypothetical protein
LNFHLAPVSADAEVSHAPGLRRAGLSALKFKPDAACRSFSLVQLPVGRWLKLALALTLQYGSGVKGAVGGPIKWRKVQIRAI